MRIILILFGILCSTLYHSFSQDLPTEKVFLTNDSVYTGIIMEQIPGQAIVLWRAQQNDTLTIPYPQIKKISKVFQPNLQPSKKTPPSKVKDTIRVDSSFTDTTWHVNFSIGAGRYVGTYFGQGLEGNIFLERKRWVLGLAYANMYELDYANGNRWWGRQYHNRLGLCFGHIFATKNQKLSIPIIVQLGGAKDNSSTRYNNTKNYLPTMYYEYDENAYYIALESFANYQLNNKVNVYFKTGLLIYRSYGNAYEYANVIPDFSYAFKNTFYEIPIFAGLRVRL